MGCYPTLGAPPYSGTSSVVQSLARGPPLPGGLKGLGRLYDSDIWAEWGGTRHREVPPADHPERQGTGFSALANPLPKITCGWDQSALLRMILILYYEFPHSFSCLPIRRLCLRAFE